MGLNRNLGQLTEVIKESSGKIGIGTTAPNYGLNVVSSDITLSGIVSNRFIGLRKENNTLPGYLGLLGGDNGDSALIIGYNSAGTQTLQISASTLPTYFNGGNVGIGVPSPTERLEIAGLVGNIRIYGRSGIAQNQISSNVYYNGSAWVRDTSSGAIAIGLDSNSGVLTFHTTAATSGFPEERMRITSGGSVGIGTTSPAEKLDVRGNSYFGNGSASYNINIGSDSNYGYVRSNNASLGFLFGTRNSVPLIFNTNDTERMRITSGGNVGIGTTDPGFNKLYVAGRVGSQNFRNIAITLQTTPQSLGLPINAGSGGGAYLLLISTQFDAGNGTAAALWMIRCGYDGNNFGAVQITSSNSTSNIAFSQVNGILHISGNTNWAAYIQVISNNLLF